MIVLLRQDPRRCAGLSGGAASGCHEVLVEADRPTHAVAALLDHNPLAGAWRLARDTPGRSIITWSGSLADDLSEPHPQNWMPAGRAALDELCERIAPMLAEHDRQLIFRPHSRHVLSDPPSCLKFIRDHGGEPFGIALDPASMFEPSMIDDVEDHLTRMIRTLGPSCALVMLDDLRAAADGASCEAVPLGRGALPRDLTNELLEQHVPPGTLIAISADDPAGQLEWLGGALSPGVDRS